jgi:tetratricopeptide (TPR) repeat protein
MAGTSRSNVRVLALILQTAIATGLLAATAGCVYPARVRDSMQVVSDLLLDQQERRERAQGQYNMGLSALREGRRDDAQQCFMHALELDPYHGAAHNDLGVVHFEAGDLYEAAVQFDAASKYLPKRHEPLYNMGLVLEEGGQLRQAADAYSHALRLAPDDLAVMEALARTWVKLDHDYRETVGLLRECLTRERSPEWQRWITLQLCRLAPREELP